MQMARYFEGGVIKLYNIELLAVVLLFVCLVVYCVRNIRKRYMLLIMLFSIFLFLISRPLICTLRGTEWAYFSDYALDTAMLCIICTLAFMYLGFKKAPSFKKRNFRICTFMKSVFNDSAVKIFVTVLLVASFACSFYMGVRKFLYYHNRSYEDFYVGDSINFPVYITFFAGMLTYLLAVVLSCNYSKKISTFLLALYVLTGSFDFLLGNRTSVMGKIMFSFIYYCIRNFSDSECGSECGSESKKEKWIGRFEKVLLFVMVPVCIVGLGVMNYARGSKDEPEGDSVFYYASDFFYRQGTTFETLCQGLVYKSELKEADVNYTFGVFADYINDSTIAQVVLGTQPYPEGNSIERATESHSMAHRLSYIHLGEEYLEGMGRGSSFIIELFIDFGYIGLMVYSFLLGWFCRYVTQLSSDNQLFYFLGLIVLTDLFMITRREALGIFLFLLKPHFWLPLFGMIFIYWGKGILQRRRLGGEL